MRKKIIVQYFAILREQRGVKEESVETAAMTPGELYEELRALHRFTLSGRQVRAAVNDAMVDNSTILRDGDHVVFVPPVAGG
jgi:molybdopterin converting factor subunit 1